MKPSPTLTLLIVGLALTCPMPSLAQPSEVAYQGELREHGSRFTGTAQMKFVIIKDGASLWSNDSSSVAGAEPEGSVSVPVVNGIFTVYLGASPMRPLTPDAFLNAAGSALRVWVKTAGAFEQLSDQRLASVPFALHAPGGGAQWSESDSNVFRKSGNVGIGTATPDARLVVESPAVGQKAIRVLNSEGNRIVDVGSYGGGTSLNDNGGSLQLFDHSGDVSTGVRFTAARGQPSFLADGKLGIGTVSPSKALDVHGGVAFQGNHIYLRNPEAPPGHQTWGFVVANSDGRLSIGRATDGIPSGGTLQGVPMLRISDSGETSVQVLEITGGSDLAEPFLLSPSEDTPAPPGSVMSIDAKHPGRLIVSRTAYDRRVAGVVSGANGISPGMVMHSIGRNEVAGDHRIALTGRVYVRASTCNGPIEPGDLLTTSRLPGIAMKATDLVRARGAVLGKAMSGLDRGEGLLLLLVQPQ